MRKLTAIVLTISMLCSMLVIPAAATTADRSEIFKAEVQYIDILSTAKIENAEPAFRDSFKDDGSLYSDTGESVFTQNRTDTQYNSILNTMWIGYGYKGASFVGTNQTVHFFDITDSGFEVIEEGTASGTRATRIDTEGVISYEKGATENYNTKYYKVDTANASYKLGPVSVEDEDPATDVFYSPNSVYLGGNKAGEAVGSQTFENINLSGKSLNILMETFEFEGDASIIPVQVSYTTGSPETFYVFNTNAKNADRLSTLVKVLPKKADGTYTQQELVDNANNFEYLTAAKREELGITIEDIDEIIFDCLAENINFIIPEKTPLMHCNRNASGELATNHYVESISLPIDAERVVSTVTITNWYSAVDVDKIIAPHGERLSAQGTETYHKITIPGYEGDNEFYALFGRTCQKRSVLLGMSVTALSYADKIKALNEKLDAIDAETITEEECEALRAEIAALKAENSAILDSDFNTEKLEAAEERIADADRVEGLNNRYINVDMEFYQDLFATDNELNNSNWYKNSTASEPNIYGYKGFDTGMTSTIPNTYGHAFKVSKVDETTGMSKNEDGSYTFTIGNIPYKMGKISKEDGVLGANAWVPRVTYKSIEFNDTSKLNPYNTAIYGEEATAADDATYTIGKSGISNVNVMSMVLGSEMNRFMKVGVKYEGEDEKVYYHIIGQNTMKFEDQIMLWPVANYNKLMADNSKTVGMKTYNEGGNHWEQGTANDTYNALREATKYYVYKNDRSSYQAPVKMSSLVNVDLSKLSDNNDSEEIYFPQASEKFVASSANTNTYAHTVAIPTDPNKKIETVRILSDIEHPDKIAPNSGGFFIRGVWGVAEAMLRVKYDGQDTITINGTEYVMLMDVTRECTESAVFGMTLTNSKTTLDEIAEVNEQLAAAETREEIMAAFEAMNALIAGSNGTVLEKDFDTASALAKLEELERVEELKKGEKYDMPAVEWDYKDNAEYLINAFEDSSVESIESTTRYYESIKEQKYINTASAISHDTIAEVLEKESADTDGDGAKNYTGSPRGMSFYPTNKIQDATGTFPAADGKYYITTPKGVKFRINGVTSTVGGNTFNAGYVTMNPSDADGGSIYKVDFDGETMYNSVNLLVAGVGEPVWNASDRISSVAQANVYYADGTSEKQLVVIPSVWGYVPTIAGKLKDENQVSGIMQTLPYVVASYELAALCSDETKFSWTPSNIDAEVFSVGSYMTTANVNHLEERHAFTEMTNKAGAMASVKVDTKGKAVDYIEITHTEDAVLEAAGAFNAATNGDTNVYWLPISNEDVLDLFGGDKAGVLLENAEAKVSDCDFYIRLQRNCVNSERGAMGILMAASGKKKYASLMDYINEAEAEMAKITALSSMEDAAYAEEVFNKTIAMEGIKESDFDATILATFKDNLAIVKQKANVSGTIEMTYVAGEKPVANVTIKNLSALAGKPYKVIIACYDEYENLLGTTVKDFVSSTEKEVTFTVTAKELPDGTKSVKGFIWKDFTTLIPLAAADEAAASSYALDNFFDAETGKFKKSEGELNIVFIGDSLTQGATTYDGDDSALSDNEKLHWTKVVSDYFAEQTGRKVNMYNAGVGGVQTSFVAKMISQTVEKTNADIIFIENVNDLNTSTTDSQRWTENLVRNLAKLDKKPVVIMAHAVSPFVDKTSQTNHITSKDAVAKDYNLASIDYMTYYYNNTNGFDTTSDWMQEDYGETKIANKDVHPQAAGYNRFGNYIVSQISANPASFITRITPAENVAVMYADTADLKYSLTYPTSNRFTYEGFNTYTKTNPLTGYTTNDAECLIDWKYNFPHGGAAQAITTNNGASIEFTTDAKVVEIIHSSPYLTNRRADFVVYVDGNEVVNNTTSNLYANVLNTTAVTLDGEGLHKIKVEVKQDSTGVKNVFNFAYIVEQK